MSTTPETKSRDERQPDERARPIFARRAWTGTGSVEVAVFDRLVEDKESDRAFRVFNIVARRSWKEEKGYQSSNTFRTEDILPLSLFLQEAYSFIAAEQSKK